jgi:hypothetical protein
MFQLQLFLLLLHCDEWDRVVALPRHKFVTGATLLQLVFSTNKTDRLDIDEMLLKVALNTITPKPHCDPSIIIIALQLPFINKFTMNN